VGFDSAASLELGNAVDVSGRIAIKFSGPERSPWLLSARRTRVRLRGDAHLQFEGANLVITGSRPQWLLPASAQEVRFALSDVVNVSQAGCALSFEVRRSQKHKSYETVQFLTTDAAVAADLVRRLPATRNERFDALAENLLFRQTLSEMNSPVVAVPVLIALNLLMFAITWLAGANLLGKHTEVLLRFGADQGILTLNGQWWRLFSSMFLHFGWWHIAANLYVLWASGPMIEKLFGSLYFSLLYVIAGLCGSIASALVHPFVVSAGASGAIFGLFGGLIAFMLNPRTRLPPSVVKAQRNGALLFAGYSLFSGFTATGVDNAAHLGGLLGGLAIGFLLARPLNQEAREQDELPRFGVVSAVAVSGLIAVLWCGLNVFPGRGSEVRFVAQYDRFVAEIAAAQARVKAVQGQLMQRQVSSQQAARELETDILPLLGQAKATVSTHPLPEASRWHAVQVTASEYADERITALALVAKSLTRGDARVPDQVSVAIAASDRTAQQLGKLAAAAAKGKGA
jgi:rhomboid protease GluP